MTAAPDPLDHTEALARIRHMMQESDKFHAEQTKLIAESQKFAAEQQKLYAEGLKLQRDRWLAPIIVAASVAAAVAAVVSLLLK